MTNTISAALFDMDGVLVDSEPAHQAVMLQALQQLGMPLPSDDEWLTVFHGRPDRDGLEQWLAGHWDVVNAVMELKLSLFMERFGELVEPFADGQWLARELHAAGLPLALVTGARRAEAERVLAQFGLTELFAAVVTADDLSTGKPNPEPYLAGARELGVLPEHCIVIEDSEVGMIAAQAAGAQLIVVDRLGHPERFAPLSPIRSISDGALRQILDAMPQGRSSSSTGKPVA